jgi:Sec-independent protein translocase protein TatA
MAEVEGGAMHVKPHGGELLAILLMMLVFGPAGLTGLASGLGRSLGRFWDGARNRRKTEK